MMRVVVDTNVLISGTFWKGDSAKIVSLVEEGKITLILSSEIIAEYNKVMDYDEIKQKVGHHHERAQAVQKLMQIGMIVTPKKSINIIKEDPDDNKFIETAVAGKADVIVSQDNHLLKLKNYENMKILTPLEFLKQRT